jgi:hypothetical protein
MQPSFAEACAGVFTIIPFTTFISGHSAIRSDPPRESWVIQHAQPIAGSHQNTYATYFPTHWSIYSNEGEKPTPDSTECLRANPTFFPLVISSHSSRCAHSTEQMTTIPIQRRRRQRMGRRCPCRTLCLRPVLAILGRSRWQLYLRRLESYAQSTDGRCRLSW